MYVKLAACNFLLTLRWLHNILNSLEVGCGTIYIYIVELVHGEFILNSMISQ